MASAPATVEDLHTICTRSASLLDPRELPWYVTRAKARGSASAASSPDRLGVVTGGHRVTPQLPRRRPRVRATMNPPGRPPLRSRSTRCRAGTSAPGTRVRGGSTPAALARKGSLPLRETDGESRLEYVRDVPAALREMHRALRRGGRVLASSLVRWPHTFTGC